MSETAKHVSLMDDALAKMMEELEAKGIKSVNSAAYLASILLAYIHDAGGEALYQTVLNIAIEFIADKKNRIWNQPKGNGINDIH
jgi:hypothetical protein